LEYEEGDVKIVIYDETATFESEFILDDTGDTFENPQIATLASGNLVVAY